MTPIFLFMVTSSKFTLISFFLYLVLVFTVFTFGRVAHAYSFTIYFVFSCLFYYFSFGNMLFPLIPSRPWVEFIFTSSLYSLNLGLAALTFQEICVLSTVCIRTRKYVYFSIEASYYSFSLLTLRLNLWWVFAIKFIVLVTF